MKSEMGEMRKMMVELLKRSGGGGGSGGGATARTKADVIAGGGAALEDWEIASEDEPAEERARREKLEPKDWGRMGYD